MLKISVKRHVLSVLYSIRQHDTPKSRDSRAVFLKVGKSRALDQKVGKSRKSRKSRDTGQPGIGALPGPNAGHRLLTALDAGSWQSVVGQHMVLTKTHLHSENIVLMIYIFIKDF